MERPHSRLQRRLKMRALRAAGRAIGTLTHVQVAAPVAALTFDDGPDPEYTPRLLSLLERHAARATFFVIGERATEHPELLRRIARGGHAIGNHTWDHPSLPRLASRERVVQLERCATAIRPHGSMLLRPPYSEQSLASFVTVRRRGYEVVAWNVQVEDWCAHPAGVMEDWLVQRVKPGCIVVLHDSLWNPRHPDASDREPLFQALDAALDRLSEFQFVTIPELMSAGRPIRVPWIVGSEGIRDRRRPGPRGRSQAS